MQYWFNITAVNETEDIIEAYFHIYKRRAVRPGTVASGSHKVTVSYYTALQLAVKIANSTATNISTPLRDNE